MRVQMRPSVAFRGASSRVARFCALLAVGVLGVGGSLSRAVAAPDQPHADVIFADSLEAGLTDTWQVSRSNTDASVAIVAGGAVTIDTIWYTRCRETPRISAACA